VLPRHRVFHPSCSLERSHTKWDHCHYLFEERWEIPSQFQSFESYLALPKSPHRLARIRCNGMSRMLTLRRGPAECERELRSGRTHSSHGWQCRHRRELFGLRGQQRLRCSHLHLHGARACRLQAQHFREQAHRYHHPMPCQQSAIVPDQAGR